MRPIALADLEVALRALLAAPPDARKPLAHRLLAEAEMADLYRSETGLLHPVYGSGTLMSAAMCYPLASRPAAYDTPILAILSCLIKVIREASRHHED